jgi:hypothetical protein
VKKEDTNDPQGKEYFVPKAAIQKLIQLPDKVKNK